MGRCAVNPDESPTPEEQFSRLLAAWDDALAAGSGIPTLDEPNIPAEVKARLELHQRSEAIWNQLTDAYPTVIAFQNGLAISHQRHGIVLEHLGKLDEAERGYRISIAIQGRLAQKYPAVDGHTIRTSALLNNLGVIYDRRHDLAGAEEHFRRALAQLERARGINPLNPTTQILSSAQSHNLAEVLLRLGRYQEAAPLIHAAAHYYALGWWNYAQFLRELQECTRRAENDAALTGPKRAALVRHYQDLTLDLVKRMIGEVEDKRPLPALRSDPNLDHVRQRAEFQGLWPP